MLDSGKYKSPHFWDSRLSTVTKCLWLNFNVTENFSCIVSIVNFVLNLYTRRIFASIIFSDIMAYVLPEIKLILF